ncbi:MAG: serine/threonine protein kinase, partial [Myxococcales bacterium]|nr:serine/threonine protein kinase [Myxococcales bacterium]
MSALPIPPGVPFGKYVIRTRLGQGGMGEVFLADQLGPLGPVRPVALKRLLPKHTHDPHVVRMFLEEMGVAAQLSHPHIVVTYDFGELDGAYFLAMEYVDGLALDRLVAEQGPLPLDAVVTLGRHIASALQHAHERVSAGAPTPVVHQDVTPHNILVSRAGDAKLLDFGIARTEAAALGERVHAKVRYAAPEQLRRAPPDRRFDVWGLGVTLYQALTGRLPFPQADLPSRVRA